MSSYVKMIHLVGEREAVHVVCLDCLPKEREKLATHGLDGWILGWVRNWLDGRAQRVVMNGVKSSWWSIKGTQGSV